MMVTLLCLKKIDRLSSCLAMHRSFLSPATFGGRVLDSRPKGRGLEPHPRHCVVVLEQDHIYPSLVLVQPRNTRPYITERLLMGRKESNQTKKKPPPSVPVRIGAFNFSSFRLRAKKGPAPPPPPPLGNFADISYLEENFKPHLLRDVCTLCSGALVSDSLLHMLL